MKILIAEDDQVSRRVLTANLIKCGHKVVAVSNGLEAWQALQRDDAPHLAILDWMMPEMEGLEVCRRLRHRPGKWYLSLMLRGNREATDRFV